MNKYFKFIGYGKPDRIVVIKPFGAGFSLFPKTATQSVYRGNTFTHTEIKRTSGFIPCSRNEAENIIGRKDFREQIAI